MKRETGTFPGFFRTRSTWVAVIAAGALSAMMGLNQAEPLPSAVDPTGRSIDKLVFDGLETVEQSFVQGVVRITAGQTWDAEAIRQACVRLAETGKFEGSPFAEAREEDGKLVLAFVLRERPFVTQIDFVGNRKFKAKDLLGEIDIYAGAPISPYLVNEAKQAIVRKYREAGYPHASVEVDEKILDDERRVVFMISEGPRVKVRHIRCEGNQVYEDDDLESKIETKTYLWLFRTGAFDEEAAERDVATLRKFYNDRGYLDAQVGYKQEVKDEKNLTLTFQIEEGIQYRIKSIKPEGNTVFDDDQILASMRSDVEKPIDAEILEADRKRILDDYGRLGYIDCTVEATHIFDQEEGYVNVSVKIKEDEKFRIGEIEIRGNQNTKDNVVRRQLRFYPEEDYNTEKVRRAEQQLVETRLFSEARITPQPSQTPGVKNALVDVEEQDTTSILFGVGVSTNSGVGGQITIEQRNFDIGDWPRSAREFFHGRSFRGAGQIMRLSLEPGTETNQGSIEFREPSLLDKELGFSIRAYVFDRGRDAYEERRVGFTPSIDKRWQEGFLKGWATELALRFESIRVDDVRWNSAKDIEKEEGSHLLTSAKGTLLRDTTDSRWLPSKGDRFKVSLEQAGLLGGEYSFSKVMTEYEKYWTVHQDVFDRKHIIQAGAVMGNIFGYAPVFERFYAGGIGSVRGFEFRGISPRGGYRDDAIGGDFMLLTNAEYSFPLMGKTVRGVTFVDMGTVEDSFGISDWRASVGAGVRIYIPALGPIPLAFDLGFPVLKNGDDDDQVFSFSFGTTF